MSLNLTMDYKSKKPYIKPDFEVFRIDQEISLIMMTGETDPGGGDPRGAAQQTTKFEKNSFNDNPFLEK